MLALSLLLAPAAGAAPLILNEYNAVDDDLLLENEAADPFWGRRNGNGGDWFELVVVADHLDIRQWEFVVVNRAGAPDEESFSIRLTSHPIWSDLRAGTIVTISEDLPNNVDDYEPAAGRWWINVRASPATNGTYATVACISPPCDPATVNWKLSNNDSQITIKDAVGNVVFGPAGEGIKPVTGVGSTEVFKLEEDPSASVTPLSNYNDGSSSTFGQPNVFGGGTQQQDLTALRSVVPYEPMTSVRINEFLAHSDPGVDWVELYNPTAQPVDIGGWFLSDRFDDLTRFEIPAGTVIPAGGYLVFDETQIGFGLSSPCGDEIILSAGDGVSPTGPRDYAEFGPTDSGVTIGRYPNGSGDFVRLASATPGASNSLPAAPPVVVNEIMYHPLPPPPPLTINAEFVELYNRTDAPVSLATTFAGWGTFPWKITGGIDFEFSPGTTIAPRGFLLVVPFDPALEPQLLDEFRTFYGLDTSTPIVGPYQGKLDNFSDRIRLRKPDTPDPNGSVCGDPGAPSPYVPYVAVERIHYRDFAPWPEAADGTGASLERFDPEFPARNPRNWAASEPGGPTPGAANTISGALPSEQQRCILTLNKDLAKMAKTAGKEALRCLKDAAFDKLGTMTAEECLLADPRQRVAKVEGKVVRDFGKSCTGTSSSGMPKYPYFGASDSETVTASGALAPQDALHDIFGPDLDVSVIRAAIDKAAAKCQLALAKDALRCIDAVAKEFSKCKKSGLGDASIVRTPELASCFGVDPAGKIAKACDPDSGRIGRDLVKRCSGLGVDLLSAFPGCGSSDPTIVGNCLNRAGLCRACRMLDQGDRLGLDCDVADDGLANGSCLAR
ncbi:MAG: lamin tail domain-containing protein [Candidatus Dadabacteria bacterium]|nr:MAG: lamin tail domain-containing protein [Candidatus Dadabacteria bacterium]